MYNYKARFYDLALGRFISPDTITPGRPQGLNRYSYSNNNPINYNDPSGHMAADCGGFGCGADTPTSTTTTTEGNSWQYTINTTYSYHVGPFGNPRAPYYDDDGWNGAAVVYNKNRDANFWVKLSITWNESKGITISSMDMSNYSDYAILFRGVEITSGSKTTYGYSNYDNGNEMRSGYGVDTPISLPSTPFDGNKPLVIATKIGYFADTGHGPFPITEMFQIYFFQYQL